jgi:hypothetical protein
MAACRNRRYNAASDVVAGVAVRLESSVRQRLKVPGKPVEPVPYGGAHVERDARQIVMMALPIASLPFRTGHRHVNPLICRHQCNVVMPSWATGYRLLTIGSAGHR